MPQPATSRAQPLLFALLAALVASACTTDYGIKPYDQDEGYATLEAGLTGEFPGSKWTPSPNYTNASRKVGSVKVVVVHTTQGQCPGCIGWMANPKAKVSAHYVVQKNGVVTQMVKEEDIAWHAGSANGYTIGIEHEGFVTDPNWATPALLESSAKLTCYLVKKWNLPATKTGIKGHVELPNQTHTDPGKFWPWANYLAKVQACTNGNPPPTCPPSCDDKNVCTTDSCSSGKCVHANNTAACNDNNACTSGEKCAGGGCKGGTAKDCDDKNACTTDSCAAGACKHANNTAACSDGNGCTAGDVCAVGKCKAGAAKNCDDKNACTDDSCAANACKNANNTATCWDGDACTVGEKCGGGKCGGGAVAKDCNDNNPCTKDACTKGNCVHTAATGACDDGNGCTTGESCASGKCAGGQAKTCNDSNPCTSDSCQAGGCVFAPNAVPCDDGDPCTSGDGCGGGSCAGGVPKACDDNNACTDDSCTPGSGGGKSSGACNHAPNAEACDDGNGCTGGDSCAAGSCKGGAAKACDDANPCTKDACVAGACIASPLEGTCDDGDDCTSKDACADGSCKGKDKDCDDKLACTTDTCKDGACKHEGVLKAITKECSGDDVIETDACGGIGKVLDTCSDGMNCDGGQCVPTDAVDASASDVQGDASRSPGDAGEAPEDAAAGGTDVDATASDAAAAGQGAGSAKPDVNADGGANGKSDALKASDAGPGAAAVNNAVPDPASGCTAARTGTDGGAWLVALMAAFGLLLRRRRFALTLAALTLAACTSDYGVQPYVEHPGYGEIQAALSGEFPGSDYQQSPNYTNASRGIGAVKVVVVHTVQGSYAGCISWFKNPASNVSAHYVVSKTGAVTQMVKEEDIGWHVGSENGYTIGIEHEGFVTDPNYATPQMIEASSKLTCYLLKKWKLPANKTAVKGHVELPNQTHTDPGKFWPWDPYMAKIASCVDGSPPPKPEPAGCCSAKVPVSGSKIIDNVGNDCIQKFGPSSSWWTGNVDKVQGNDGTVTYTYTSTAASAENWARWRLSFDKPGKYKVEAFVPNNYATAKPTYVVRHNGANSTYVVDQKPMSNAWADLGTHDFAANCDEYVSVGDNTGQAYSKAVMLGIDMVRVTAIAPPPTCPASCDDKNVCTDDSCQNGKCVHANNTIVCWDQDACTVGEKCSNGGCSGGKITKDCNDNNACTDDGCTASNCTHANNMAGCDDGNACTSGDKCSAGSCKGGGTKNCDDGNPCTADACSGGSCTHAPGGGGCNDGDACTTNDSCQGGACKGKAKVCAASNACTGGEVCQNGACVANAQGKSCDDGNPCTDDSCASGVCKHAPNAAGCDDGNGCTEGDACKGGSCAAGGAKACQDGNPCTQDACAGGACVFAPTGGGCDDGDTCTENDTCKDGDCSAGDAKDCDDDLECTTDACADGDCTHDGETTPETKTCNGLDVEASDPCGGEAKVVATCTVACVDGACQDAADANAQPEDAKEPDFIAEGADATADGAGSVADGAGPGVSDGKTASGDAKAGSDAKLGLGQDGKSAGAGAAFAAPPPADSGCNSGSGNGSGAAGAIAAAALLALAAHRRRRRA